VVVVISWRALFGQDTFLTSWSSERGYHLYCWEKTVYTPYVLSPTIAEECKEAMTEPAECAIRLFVFVLPL
jgi:hypothetical protein